MIPFSQPDLAGNELQQIAMALESGKLAGNGQFTALCEHWLESKLGVHRALLAHSGTGALEMAALIADIRPGDEVIMPSFTFSSTANAFVLRGASPVFVDVRPDTLNLDERLIAERLTPRTRAIVPVHYGGVSCEMDAIMALANLHGLTVIEDAAQALLATYKGVPLGTIGHLSAFSFHATKNVTSGEGGALILKTSDHALRAEIIREKGTNRSQFIRGEVDKYTWSGLGSSYVPSEILAALLWSQLNAAHQLTEQRLVRWQRYHAAFAQLEREGMLTRPNVPGHCHHNGHVYYILLDDTDIRGRLIDFLRERGICVAWHFIPLHSSPYATAQGWTCSLPVTDDISGRILRLPMFASLGDDDQARVIKDVVSFFGGILRN
ncbi:MAG: dTDP-4-amino-4,6-dideoxygalactose transaminase [Magnetococcales bacterium]|nr:dTDP-4-amino-4,6-dideoxygalactose transaminase [Magnetococcales bacterium]